MKLWLYRHAVGTFVYGDRAKRLLIEQGIPEDKLFAIHNSLDYDTQKTLRKSIQTLDIYKIISRMTVLPLFLLGD